MAAHCSLRLRGLPTTGLSVSSMATWLSWQFAEESVARAVANAARAAEARSCGSWIATRCFLAAGLAWLVKGTPLLQMVIWALEIGEVSHKKFLYIKSSEAQRTIQTRPC